MPGIEKNIAVRDLHHQVLEDWCRIRKNTGIALKVLTFDFHTDTLSALRRGICAPEEGDYMVPEKTAYALNTLHHDEHFDWALRSGVISEGLICAISPQNGPCSHERLSVRAWRNMPDVNDILREPEAHRAFVDSMLSEENLRWLLSDFLSGNTPFILDIDCDFFLTEKMLAGAAAPFFTELVRTSCLVTLSKESDWVRLLRFPGENNLSGEFIASYLYEHFSRVI